MYVNSLLTDGKTGPDDDNDDDWCFTASFVHKVG